MKKLFSLLLTITIIFGCLGVVFAEDVVFSEFEITSDGEITRYFGEEWVVIPEKVDGVPVNKIGEQAFFDLGITDVYLPESLSVIGKSAFEGSTVSAVDIPSALSIIGERAFANCAELITVYAEIDENTVIGEDAFAGTGHLSFFLNCDVDTKTVERNILLAKGDRNFDVEIRHTAAEYNEDGIVKCAACGYSEQYLWDLPFTDVPYDAWYYDYVMSAYSNRIINGKSETIFDPDAGMTCAEAAKIAACINAIYFDAIPEYVSGPWYQPYVDYCYEHGLIEKDVVFDWDKPITRGQMAYIFSHCDPFDEWYIDINNVPITDIPDVNNKTSYAPEILVLYNKGIVVGDENMNFYPNDNIKRCEAAAIVSRIIDWHLRIELPKG